MIKCWKSSFVGPFVAAGLIHRMGIAGAYWAGIGSLVVAIVVAYWPAGEDLTSPACRQVCGVK